MRYCTICWKEGHDTSVHTDDDGFLKEFEGY